MDFLDLQVHQLLRHQVQSHGAYPGPVGSETPRANRGDRPPEPSSSDGQNRRGHDPGGPTGSVALNERNLDATWRSLWWVKVHERTEWTKRETKSGEPNIVLEWRSRFFGTDLSKHCLNFARVKTDSLPLTPFVHRNFRLFLFPYFLFCFFCKMNVVRGDIVGSIRGSYCNNRETK